MRNSEKHNLDQKTQKLTNVSNNQHDLGRQALSVFVIVPWRKERTRKLQSHHRVFLEATTWRLSFNDAAHRHRLQTHGCRCATRKTCHNEYAWTPGYTEDAQLRDGRCDKLQACSAKRARIMQNYADVERDRGLPGTTISRTAAHASDTHIDQSVDSLTLLVKNRLFRRTGWRTAERICCRIAEPVATMV
jgi:hypothetical protein